MALPTPVVIGVENNTQVRIQVRGDTLTTLSQQGGKKLWPEKQAAESGEIVPQPDQYWLFTFNTPQEAQAFAMQAQVQSDQVLNPPPPPPPIVEEP